MDLLGNPLSTSHVTMTSRARPRNTNDPGPRSGMFPCEDCGKILSRRDALVRHNRLLHGKGQNYWCYEPQCLLVKKGFLRLHDYKKHMLHVHNTVISPGRVSRPRRRDRDRGRGRASTNQSPVPQQRTLEIAPRDQVQPEAQQLPRSEVRQTTRQIAPYPTLQASAPASMPDLNYTTMPAVEPTDWYSPLPTTQAQAPAPAPAQRSPFVDVAFGDLRLNTPRDNSVARAAAIAQQSLLIENVMRNPTTFSSAQFGQLFSASVINPQQESERSRSGAVLPTWPVQETGQQLGNPFSWGGQ